MKVAPYDPVFAYGPSNIAATRSLEALRVERPQPNAAGSVEDSHSVMSATSRQVTNVSDPLYSTRKFIF